MKNYEYIILLGYDYLDSLVQIDFLERTTIIIAENDLIYFDQEKIKLCKRLIDKQLIICDSPTNYLQKYLNNPKRFVLISLGWRKILNLKKIPPFQYLINIHPAILPQYKGYHPVPHVILNEEKEHGITAHLIEEKIDAGKIVQIEKFPINKFSTINSLQNLVNEKMTGFLNRLLKNLDGHSIKFKYNDSNQTKIIAPKRTPKDSELKLSDSVETMFKLVKASDSDRFPAYFIVDSQKIYIKLYRDKNESKENRFDL